MFNGIEKSVKCIVSVSRGGPKAFRMKGVGFVTESVVTKKILQCVDVGRIRRSLH